MSELLTTIEIAEYLNFKPVTIRRKAKRGEIPSIRIGNRLRFDKKQIDRWLLQRSNGGPLHILVIDDEPVIGQLFKDSLKEYDYEVTTTLSSLEALELVSNRHFDLIFLDLLMPEFDGAELLHHIRRMDGHMPMAIIAGYSDSDLMNRAMEHGPLIVMKKPFDSNQILDAVRSFTKSTAARE